MKKTVCFILVFVLIGINFTFFANAQNQISLSAKGAVLINADTCEVILEKNCHQTLPMASTTKIMTSLILAEQPDLSKTVIVTKEMITVEGSSMGLLEGDTVSYKDLLYGMLLASGNDAANTTAIVLGGSVEGFVKIMNDKARELGLTNTSFVTPSGLDDENHYTTPYELGVLTAYALKNPVFRAACSSKSAVLYYGNPPYKRVLNNHNKLLSSYEGLIGVKTGFTKKSGRCLVTAAKRNSVTLIAVTLSDPNDWEDHRNMLDYGFNNTQEVSFDNSNVSDVIPVICGDCDSVRIKAESVSFGVTKQNSNNIVSKVLIPKFVYSSLSSGEQIGAVNYYLKGKLIYSAPVVCLADVKVYNRKESILKRVKEFLKLLLNYV